MVNRIYMYPAELQLKKATSSDTEARFWIWTYPFLMAQFPLKFMINGTILILILLISHFLMETSYGVYISQLIRFARAYSNVSDFSCRNKALTAKLLKQGYRYHKLLKAFSKFYRRHSELVKNIMLAWGNFCNKAYQKQNFMVT